MPALSSALPSPTEHLDPGRDRDNPEPKMPAWVSAFILFGALGALVVLFTMVYWVAKVFPGGQRPSPLSSPAQGSGSGSGSGRAEDSETVAQKVRQLDQHAPAKQYHLWKNEMQGEDKGKDKSGGSGGDNEPRCGIAAQYSTWLVCVICLEQLQDTDLVRRLPCDHVYHSDCITQWYLKRHHDCPLCKNPYVPGADAGDESRREASRRQMSRNDAALFRIYQSVPI